MKYKDVKDKYSALNKLERDYRDVSLFPEVKREIEKLYQNWKELIIEFEKVNDEI